MLRRVLLPLRAWSGVLLVCAVVVCLSGLARPAMAMSMAMSMPEPMVGMAHQQVGKGQGHERLFAEAVPMSTAGVGSAAGTTAAKPSDPGGQCPMAEQHCAASKAAVAQDGPAGGSLFAELPRAMACSPAALASQPNAPPPALPPPDPQRLCVSRT
ncbi:hypothetical protein [Streptomyces platensis]|uniref:hypothetical protein n=1 Tax=Streptomyces platensis TaxID=58346 RepID=UPI0037884E6B